MTKEEAIARIKDHKIVHKMNEPRAIYISEALDMAIEALEQEPCGDTISRKEVFEQINCWIGSGEYRYTNATYYLMKRIRDIPPVTLQSKRGKWLNGELIPNDITGHWYAECSECGKVRIVDNYCPNCGARMKDTKDEISE